MSDRDSIFMSKFWQELFRLSGTKLFMSSAYHPQTDGQTETLNRVLQQYLSSYAMDRPQDWVSYLAWAEFAYNVSRRSKDYTF